MYHQPAYNLDQNRIAHTNMVINYDTYPQANPSFPVCPPVKLKKLAFYDVLFELIKPSTLIPSNNHQRIQEKTFAFHMTPQQATDLASNRDIRNPAKIEHIIQVQLRFCQLDTTTDQEDCFPPNVIVKVNNKPCQLPNPIPTNKPGVDPKRPPRPVNITQNVKLSPTVTNNIQISWCVEYNKTFCIAVYLVKKLTSPQLLQRLRVKGIKPAELTRGLIRDKLRADADCDIATTMLKVSLCCPLGKMRMTNPCRASTCMHLQCFDASLYLQMNERKPTWNCPVCDKSALYDNLVIDGYFQEVLASNELPTDENEIQLLEDGSWTIHVENKEEKVKEKKIQKASEVVSEDDAVIIDDDDDPPVMYQAASPNKIKSPVVNQMSPGVLPIVSASISPDYTSASVAQLNPAPTANAETVDLTLSDSDEEQPQAQHRQAVRTPQTQSQTPQLSPAMAVSYARQQSVPAGHANGTSPSLSIVNSRPASVGGGKPNDAEESTIQEHCDAPGDLQINQPDECSTSNMDIS